VSRYFEGLLDPVFPVDFTGPLMDFLFILILSLIGQPRVKILHAAFFPSTAQLLVKQRHISIFVWYDYCQLTQLPQAEYSTPDLR